MITSLTLGQPYDYLSGNEVTSKDINKLHELPKKYSITKAKESTAKQYAYFMGALFESESWVFQW